MALRRLHASAADRDRGRGPPASALRPAARGEPVADVRRCSGWRSPPSTPSSSAGSARCCSQQGASWLPWLAAGVVAVSFAPLRDALQRAANRLTFGQWAQPREVLDAYGAPARGRRRRRRHCSSRSPPSSPRTCGSGTSRSSAATAGVLASAGHAGRRARRAPPDGVRRSGRCPEVGATTLARERPRAARRGGDPARLRRARPRPARHRARRPGATRAGPRGGTPTPATRPARRARPRPGRPDACRSTPCATRPRRRRRRAQQLLDAARPHPGHRRRRPQHRRGTAARRAGRPRARRVAAPARRALRPRSTASRSTLDADAAAELPAAVEVGAYRIVQESLDQRGQALRRQPRPRRRAPAATAASRCASPTTAAACCGRDPTASG